MKLLNIKQPCLEDWSKMKIGLISRHCEVCNKEVMDFTRISREEILEYLFTHRNEVVCGRIRKSQLDMGHSELLVTIQSLSKKSKNSNLAFYLLSLSALLFNSLGEAQTIKQELTYNVYSEDSLKASCETNRETENTPIPIIFNGGTIMGKIAAFHPNPSSVAETMPEFSGGIDSLNQYIKQNLKYPEWEKKQKIQGIITVSFIINRAGRIYNPRIIKTRFTKL